MSSTTTFMLFHHHKYVESTVLVLHCLGFAFSWICTLLIDDLPCVLGFYRFAKWLLQFPSKVQTQEILLHMQGNPPKKILFRNVAVFSPLHIWMSIWSKVLLFSYRGFFLGTPCMYIYSKIMRKPIIWHWIIGEWEKWFTANS